MMPLELNCSMVDFRREPSPAGDKKIGPVSFLVSWNLQDCALSSLFDDEVCVPLDREEQSWQSLTLSAFRA
jgi:hypothetical protein